MKFELTTPRSSFIPQLEFFIILLNILKSVHPYIAIPVDLLLFSIILSLITKLLHASKCIDSRSQFLIIQFFKIKLYIIIKK